MADEEYHFVKTLTEHLEEAARRHVALEDAGPATVRFDVHTISSDKDRPLSVVNVYPETAPDGHTTVVVVLRPEIPVLKLGAFIESSSDEALDSVIEIEVDGVRRSARHVVFEDGRIVLTDRRHS